MSSLNKNKNMPIVITQSTFYNKNVRKKREGVNCDNSHAIQYFVWPPSAATTAII
jgi:hypothetical protein